MILITQVVRQSMAALALNSIPVQPAPPPSSQPRKLLLDPCPSSSSSSYAISSIPSSSNTNSSSSLKPIIFNGDPPTSVSAPGRRIIAVGDLHGDLTKARYALQMAGVLSSDGQDLWTGGATVLIQLGDIFDRGEDEIVVLSLLKSLDIQAKAQGGAVFQINGNHETMNVQWDFRYVDSGAFDECRDFLEYLNDCEHNWEEAFVSWVDVSERGKEDRKSTQNYWGPWNLVKRQKGVISRSVLLRPGGSLASELARHAVVLKVDDWIFCHGGLLPQHVAYGIERMNNEVSHWMRGLKENTDPQLPFVATSGYDSVVWNRLYSRDISDQEDCQIDRIQSILEETLQAVGAKAMVVGHTPQTTGVNCEYNCRIWRADVGMSSGVLDSTPEVLEIRENKARLIRHNRDTFSELQVVEYM